MFSVVYIGISLYLHLWCRRRVKAEKKEAEKKETEKKETGQDDRRAFVPQGERRQVAKE